MGKTYNSESARRIASADKLKFIKDYYDERENIKVRGSSTLSNLYDENYDDETLSKIYPKAKKPKKLDKSAEITYSNTRNEKIAS